jgi:hypothetical protein
MSIGMANAQNNNDELPPIQIDRPDQTECSYIVPVKHFQLESGWNIENLGNGVQKYVLPTALWKVGITNRFELRLITEYNNFRNNNGTLASGITPVRVGFKSNLTKEKGLIPMISFIGHMSMAGLASEDFKQSFYAPQFRFTLQHTLSDKMSLGYNLGAEWNGESAEPNFIYTLTTGYSITEKLGAYIELYGTVPQVQKADHRADGGFTYLLKKNMMLDISAGLGINEISKDFSYLSLGYSVRLPK